MKRKILTTILAISMLAGIITSLPVHAVPTSEHFVTTYQAEDAIVSAYRENALTTLTTDGITINAGAGGNSVWGPYIPLKAGITTITYKIKCPDVTFGGETGITENEWLANIAVYGETTGELATDRAAAIYLPQCGTGDFVDFSFTFTLTQDEKVNPVIYTTGKKQLVVDSITYDGYKAIPVVEPTTDPLATPTVAPTATPTIAPIVTSAYPIHYDFQGVRDIIGGYPHEIQSDMYFAKYTDFTADGIVIPQGNQGNFIWGPYKKDLASGNSFWTFKIKVDDNVPSDENIDSRFLRLVVNQKLDGGTWTEFKSIDDVYIDDFQLPNVFQDFTIEVPITAGAEYSMAVYSAGFKKVTMKSIDIDDSMPEVPVNTTQYPVVYDFQGERELISGYPHEIRSNLYFAPYVEFTADGVVVPQGKQGNFAWGPYVTTLPAKTTYWKFRLKVDNNEPSDENIDSRFMRIVVLQKLPEGSEAEFKSIDDVFIDDFETSDTFQDFVIEVPITEGAQYSFAIYSAGFKTVTFKSMTITDVNPNDETEITPTPTTTEEPTITEEPTSSESDPEGEIPETGDNNLLVLLAIIVSGLTLLMITKKRAKSIVNN